MNHITEMCNIQEHNYIPTILEVHAFVNVMIFGAS